MNTPNSQTADIWANLNRSHQALRGRFETALWQEGLRRTIWYDVLWGLEGAPDGFP